VTELQGWHPDSSGQHEFRYFSDREPTVWVSDGDSVTQVEADAAQPAVEQVESSQSFSGFASPSAPTGAVAAQPVASTDWYPDPFDAIPLRDSDGSGWTEEVITSTPVPERDGWVQQPTEHPMGTETADRPDRLSPTGYLDPRSSEGRLEASSVKVPRRTAWSVVFIFAGGTYLLGESVDAQLVAIWHQRATDEPPIESWDRGSVGREKAAARFIELEPDGQALEAPLVCTWLTQPSRKPLPGQHHRTGDGNSPNRLRKVDRKRLQAVADRLRRGVIACGHLRTIAIDTPLWEGESAIVQYGARRLKVAETSLAQPGRKPVVDRTVTAVDLLRPLDALGGAASSKSRRRNMVRTERTILGTGTLIFTDQRLLFVGSCKRPSTQSHLTIKYEEVSRALFTARPSPRAGRMQLTLSFKDLRPDEAFSIDGPDIDDAMDYYNGIVRLHHPPDGCHLRGGDSGNAFS